MITTKHGLKFSLLPKKKIKMTPKIKAYFKECEKIIAKEMDKLDYDFLNEFNYGLIMTPDGIKKIPYKHFFKEDL